MSTSVRTNVCWTVRRRAEGEDIDEQSVALLPELLPYDLET